MYSKEIEYIIKCFEWDTNRFIDLVLNDNLDDPEYSAVTCCNRIITLIKVKEVYKEEFKSIENYLEDIGYNKEDIKIFIESRDKESEYYHGEILSF